MSLRRPRGRIPRTQSCILQTSRPELSPPLKRLARIATGAPAAQTPTLPQQSGPGRFDALREMRSSDVSQGIEAETATASARFARLIEIDRPTDTEEATAWQV